MDESDNRPTRLDPARRRWGLEKLIAFNALNAVTFNMVVGATISVFLLRLGATNTQTGFLYALLYIATPLSLLGAFLADRHGERVVLTVGWLGRALSIVPLLFAPMVARAAGGQWGVLVGLGSVTLFLAFRAVGASGFFPMMQTLIPKRMLGVVQARLMAQMFWVGVGVFLFSAWFLQPGSDGADPPISRFLWLFGVGSLTGIISSRYLFILPYRPIAPRVRTATNVREALRTLTQPTVARFLCLQVMFSLAFMMTRTFTLLYLKRVRQLPDADLVLLDAVYMGGCIAVSHLLARFRHLIELNRMVRLCGVLGLACGAILVTSAQLGGPIWVFYAPLALVGGLMGTSFVNQTQQMLAIAPARRSATFGALASVFTQCLPGLLGPLGGGVFIDACQGAPTDPFPFQVLFTVVLAVSLVAVLVHTVRPFGPRLDRAAPSRP